MTDDFARQHVWSTVAHRTRLGPNDWIDQFSLLGDIKFCSFNQFAQKRPFFWLAMLFAVRHNGTRDTKDRATGEHNYGRVVFGLLLKVDALKFVCFVWA